MRIVFALALMASAASAQELAFDTTQYQLRVRAVDATRQAAMSISWSARIFTSIGALRGTVGAISVNPSGGTGSGTVVASLGNRPGRLNFTAAPESPELELTVARPGIAKPVLIARGRLVSVAVTSEGEYSVAAKP